METENQTNETQPDESQLNSADGNKAESVATDSLSLAEINALTGKSYKDKDSALKSIKDMSSMAGKAADLEGKLKAVVAPKTTDETVHALQEQLTQTQTEVFFSNNKEHQDNKALLETIAKAEGITVQKATESEVYLSTIEKVASHSPRTVAGSNKRIAQGGQNKEFTPQGKSAEELSDFVTQTYFKN